MAKKKTFFEEIFQLKVQYCFLADILSILTLYSLYGKSLSSMCSLKFVFELAIDGDGMLCAVSFQDGHVHFQSKFVNSKHRQEEASKQKFLYYGQMGTKPSYSAVKALGTLLTTWKVPPIEFRNPSNTNSFYWGGKVCCFW